MGVRRLSTAAIVGLGVLAFAGSAQACSCAQLPADEALKNADVAIVAKLLEVIPRDAYQSDYRFRVQRVFKSGGGLRHGATILVRSARVGPACGLAGAVGRRYGLLLSAGGEAATGEAPGVRWRGGSCAEFSPGRLRSMVREVARGGGRTTATQSSCAS